MVLVPQSNLEVPWIVYLWELEDHWGMPGAQGGYVIPVLVDLEEKFLEGQFGVGEETWSAG